MIYRASVQRRRAMLVAAVLFLAGSVWAVRHAVATLETTSGVARPYGFIYLLTFLLLAWQVFLAHMERPYTTTPEQQVELDKAVLVVNVPTYNEDPQALHDCLSSILHQTRPVQVIHVVDDGSKVDYSDVKEWFLARAAEVGVRGLWTRQDNAGKRAAQANTVREVGADADFFLTIDSDALLDSRAVEEGLKPFADANVQSVAGIVLASNNRSNVLARITDLLFVTNQLIDRSAMSRMGAVLVNSGVLAFYRADILRESMGSYLSETFLGRPVHFSDDSMLTLYARTRGKTVQQPTSFVFTLMPEKVSHHLRQQVRWRRGAFIRSFWRFRYLPVNSYAYWGHFLSWFQTVLGTAVFLMLFIITPILDKAVLPWLLVVPVMIGYAQSLRYLSFDRADESMRSRLVTIALSPLATLWSFFILRVVRWYAWATVMRTGWGTRQEVEVSATPSLEPVSVAV